MYVANGMARVLAVPIVSVPRDMASSHPRLTRDREVVTCQRNPSREWYIYLPLVAHSGVLSFIVSNTSLSFFFDPGRLFPP